MFELTRVTVPDNLKIFGEKKEKTEIPKMSSHKEYGISKNVLTESINVR